MRTEAPGASADRGPNRAEIDVSPGRAARLLGGAGAATHSILDDPLARLARGEDRGWKIPHDGVIEGEPFKAHVAADGPLTIEDLPVFEVEISGPCPSCVKEDLAAWIANPYGGRYVNMADLLLKIQPKLRVMDWIMRLGGQDPYLARKMALADGTRAERQRMAAAERARRVRESLRDLPKLLAAVWQHDEWPARRRRELLFQLWDECAETGAGLEARAIIIEFLRERKIAYPDDEIAALNRRRTSRERFAPPRAQGE